LEAVTEPSDEQQAAPRRVRRERSALESLLSIALLLEAVLVFFVALTALGLRVLPVPAALGGGVALIVLLLAAGRLVRFGWGVWLGWLLQAVLVATGILIPIMWFIGAVFLGIWIFCFVKGRQLDARKARYLAENPDRTDQ
jgi:hypothetical protein